MNTTQNPPDTNPTARGSGESSAVGGPSCAPRNRCGTAERGVFNHGHSQSNDTQPSTTENNPPAEATPSSVHRRGVPNAGPEI